MSLKYDIFLIEFYSDNSNEANLCREKIISILNDRYPIIGTREPIRCTAHIFARSESFWMNLDTDKKNLKRFAELLTQIFGPSSRNLSDAWIGTYGNQVSMRGICGVRWFSLFFNCDIAIRNWDNMMEMLNKNRSNSQCGELLDIINKNQQCLIAELLSTSLTGRSLGPVRGFWDELTARQTKRSFLDKVSKLTTFSNEVKNSKFLLESFKRFYDPEEFQQLEKIYNIISAKDKLIKQHKKNFAAITDYILKEIRPKNFSNLDAFIGKIICDMSDFHTFSLRSNKYKDRKSVWRIEISRTKIQKNNIV